MFRIPPKIAGAAALLLLLMVPAFAQYAPIDKGVPPQPCSVGPYYYNRPGERPPVLDPYKQTRKVRRADTGTARSALSFQPDSVRVELGDPIVFTPEIGWPANGRLTGDLFAIYSPAGAGSHDKYLLPVPESSLPSGSGEVNAALNPLNYYDYNGAAPKPAPESPIPSTIVRLQNRQLDTDGMPLGKYWFTLQSAINYGSGGTCHKTSSIVLIEIYEEFEPDFKIAVEAGMVSCQSIFATARIYDLKYAREEDINIKWVLVPTNSNLKPENNNRSASVTRDLIPQTTYRFQAIGILRTTGLEREASDPVTYTCEVKEPAGVVYFQFEYPDKKKPHLRINFADPESWTWGPRGEGTDKYPSEHFSKFFKAYGQEAPAITTDANTDQLNVIVEKLNEYRGYTLKIFGYADFQKTGKYDNYELSKRRIEAVVEYIRRQYADKNYGALGDRVSYQIITKPYGDSAIQTCERYKWSDARRQDRRAEMLYTPNRDAPPPNYGPAPTCPQPLRTRPAPRRGSKPRRR